MDYNYILFLLGIIISLISLGVLFNVKTKNISEHYVDQNVRSLTYCGRNVQFANFVSANLASQRAISGLDYTKNMSRGICVTPGLTQNVSSYETYSIIKDNSIFYALKRGCLGFKYKDITTTTERATITFDTTLSLDKQAFTCLLLLNPMFIEFNFGLDSSSVAYFPIYHNIGNALSSSTNSREYNKSFMYSTYTKKTLISRYGQQQPITLDPVITFEVVLPQSKKSSAYDDAFNYFTDYNPYKLLQDLQNPLVNTNKELNNINMNIYFLDDNIPMSYQTVGKTLSHPDNGNLFDYNLLLDNQPIKNLKVFNTNYINDYGQQQQLKSIYEFNNNINVFFKNNIQPVLSFNMDILLPRNTDIAKNIIIAKMFMNNNYGNYTSCPQAGDNQTITNTNNNMFMILLEFDDQKTDNSGVNIVVALGKNQSCNYSDESNTKLPIPYIVNKIFRCIFTITPTEVIIMVMWKDEDYVTTQFSLSRKSLCNNSNLTFGTMFKTNPNPAPIGNILMSIARDYVQSVKDITLGYKNLLTEYNIFNQ